MELNYTATCLFGLEKLVADEIIGLGYEKKETTDGRVNFVGDLSAIPRFNINSRFAERLYINLGTFSAKTFTELFDGVAALPLERFIGKADAFPVKGHSVKSRLTSIPDCQSIIKKAAVKRLQSVYHIDWFAETGRKYQLEFFIIRDIAALMIDTSGASLHKRGYRPISGDVPLRETLAAAMVKLARLYPDNLLWDPFCGSATIPIEAALMMANIAPGLRRNFSAEKFAFLSQRIWSDAKEEAISAQRLNTDFLAYASDIQPSALEYARQSAENAGVSRYLEIFEQDARKIELPSRKGKIICNPPYGERMMTPHEALELYKDVGEIFLRTPGWQSYIISSADGFEKAYGKLADKKRKFWGGTLQCYFYQYFR